MLAAISELRKKIAFVVVVASTVAFVSCASQKQRVGLVDDPEDHGASSIPWNKQEKWETGGQFAGMTDRR
jgi:hypothetical protein